MSEGQVKGQVMTPEAAALTEMKLIALKDRSGSFKLLSLHPIATSEHLINNLPCFQLSSGVLRNITQSGCMAVMQI